MQKKKDSKPDAGSSKNIETNVKEFLTIEAGTIKQKIMIVMGILPMRPYWHK